MHTLDSLFAVTRQDRLRDAVSVNVIDFCFAFVFQVKSLKERIEQEKGKEHFPFAGQKLIYAGMFVKTLI